MSASKESFVPMAEYGRGALLALGLAKKAGKLVCGTPLVCKKMSEKTPPALVVISDHASQNTKKRLNDKAQYYNVRTVVVDIPCEDISHATGGKAETAAVAICDSGIATLFLAKAENEIKRNEE